MEEKIKFSETSRSFIIAQLEDYLNQKGFGSMNKNDFEVLIFHALLKNRLKDKGNYEISKELKIPESKTKRLKYEADLKFGDPSIDYIEISNEKERREIYEKNKYLNFLNLIKTANFKVTDRDKIQFQIEDLALRKFLENILKKKGSFADSSFNSNVVTITSKDLNTLLDFYEGKEFKKELEEKIKRALKEYGDLEPAKTMKSYWFDLLLESVKTIGQVSGTTGKIIDLTTGNFQNFLFNSIESFMTKKIKNKLNNKQ